MVVSEEMVFGSFIGLMVGVGLAMVITAAIASDVTCPKGRIDCRIIRCERIVEENGKKTCERWGE